MTIEDFIEDRIKHPSTGTNFGHHFISAFNQNKYHWFLKFVMGFEAKHKAPALLFGGVIHDCAEAWFTCEGAKTGQAMKLVFNSLMDAHAKQYQAIEKWKEDKERGLPMLIEWANTWAVHDRDTYTLVECEQIHEVPLANGFTVTVKPDRVVREIDTGHLVIKEMKTTSYGVKAMFDSVKEQDQATMYEWAIMKDYPNETILGVLPDILYKKGNVCKAERPGYISRGPYALWRHECNLIGLYQDMAQRLEALQTGVPFEFLFPRNGKDTAYFSDEYGVLDWDKPDSRFVPEGFVCRRDEAREFLKTFLLKWNQCEKIQMPSWEEAMRSQRAEKE